MTTTYHNLASGDFSQDWSDTDLIIANNNWDGVPSIVGYRGDDLTAVTGTDPQTVLGADNGPVNVNADLTDPNSFTSGGVAEFHLDDPVVALQGSGTADAPNLVIYLDATGRQNIAVSYRLRDLDSNADDAVQAVALQYRIGDTGSFINVPDAFVADASEPNAATKETLVSAVLPAEVAGAAQLQLRILTTNAVGSDEWVGIDDILVTSEPAGASLAYSGALNEAAAYDGSVQGVILITLSGDTFTGNDGDALAAQVRNLPEGLLATVVRTSDTTAELRVSGAAASHANTDDVNILAVEFLDAAFTGGNAAGVANFTRSGLTIDFADEGAAGTVQTFIPNGQGSDASAAIALDANWVVVGDDEANVLRVYHREGGEAVKEWSYDEYLNLGGEELDLEGGTRIGDTYYFTGSSGNKKSGNDHPSRENIVAVTISGTGADTEFSAVDKFTGLEDALVAWDNADIHGNGAGYFGFAASSGAGVVPENSNGFSIEGLTAKAGDENTLLLAFRAPQSDTETRDKAVVVELALGEDGALTGASFGDAYELNLGGRGIRSIERAADGEGYLILAGPAGGASDDVTHDFRLFRWDGENEPVELDVDLDSLREVTGGSFETIVDVQSTASGTWVQLLQDNGDTVWEGQTDVSKDLPDAEQKFVGNWVQIGGEVIDETGPALQSSTPADGAGSVTVGSDIVLRFDEGVKLGSGAFVIKKAEDDSVVETLAADGGRVSVAFNVVTLDLQGSLEAGTAYYVEAAEGSVTDHYGNAWAGIADKTTLDFVTYDGAGADATLLITEINSNASGGDFFELYNYGEEAIDLSGWSWNDSKQDVEDVAAFPDGTVLAAGARLIVVSDGASAEGFRTAWSLDENVAVVVTAGPGLGKGDGVAVLDPAGALVAALNYGNTPFEAAGVSVAPATLGDGASISISEHAGTAAGGSAVTSLVWDGVSVDEPAYAAAVAGQDGAYAAPGGGVGSPGSVALPSVLITEVNSNAAGGDFFELTNYGDTAIDLSGWSFDDDSRSIDEAVAFPDGTVLAAGEKLIVITDKAEADIAAFRAAWNDLPESVKVVALDGPGLGGGGDAVVLFNASNTVVAAFNYGATTLVASDGTVIEPVARADGQALASGHAGVAVGGSGNGVSAVWDGASTTAPAYQAAVAGESGAFAQNDAAGNVGSPGAVAEPPYVAPSLLITEINSNADSGDFFELYNYGDTDLDLSGWKVDDDSALLDEAVAIPDGTVLAAGEKLIVITDKAEADIAAFRAAWNDLPESVKVVALDGPGLGGSGDAVVVFDASGNVAAALSYKPAGTSITASDGTVIEPLVRADGEPTVTGHAGAAVGGSGDGVSAVWDGESTSEPKYQAAVAGELGAFAQDGNDGNVGSPGATEAPAVPPTLLITEINSNAGNVGDFIELTNYGDADIDLTGWKLDDDSALLAEAVAIPDGTVLAAGEKLIVIVDKAASDIAAFRAAWGDLPESVNIVALDGPGLGNNGDAVVLFDASGKVAASLSYKPAGTSITASDGTVIEPLVRADGEPTASGHAGVAVGGAASTSAVWDGVSTSEPKYQAAVAGELGAFAGTVGTGSPGLTGAAAVLPGAEPNYTQPFDSAAGFADFTVYSVDADAANSWYYSSSQQAAEVNGYGDSAAADDWLISKAFNLDDTSAEFLSFRTWTRYADGGTADPEVKLLYSTDYSGSGDPAQATWQELTYTHSPADSQQWTDSGLLDLSGISGSNVYFAFQYQASGTGGSSSSQWRVDDFKIESYAGAVVSIAADDADKQEGNSGTTPFTFTVTRGGDTTSAVTLDWAVTGEGTNAADAADFAGGVLPSGTVSFAEGETSKTITIDVQGDTHVEADEGFTVTLSNADGAAIIGATAQGTIRSDEAAITKISEVQGSGDASELVGYTVTIEGILTHYAEGLSGFYVQEEEADYDDNELTSEGIFAYFGSDATIKELVAASEAGYIVQVTGTVTEYRGLTELNVTSFTVVDDSTGGVLPAPVEITLPVSSLVNWEALEGTLVRVSSGTEGGSLVVTDNYNLGRYGQVTLTSDELQVQYTEENAPGKDGYDAYNAQLQLDQIILDDGSSTQNPASHIGRNGEALSASNTLRAGDSVTEVIGVVDQYIDTSAGAHETSYRLQATETVVFTGDVRPTADDIPEEIQSAEIKVGAFNVLNYFNTLGTEQFTTPNGTSQAGRGASDADEFARQEAKIVEGILGLGADVVALNEIQNNGFGEDSALQALVDALNAVAGEGVYDFVKGPFATSTGGTVEAAGDDAISVAIIYRTDKVDLVGDAAVPDVAEYDAFSSTYGSRVPIAQTFASKESGGVFTVVANHFKSKSSGTEVQGEDAGDGQGASNSARVKAAEQLAQWLETDPTGSGSDNVLLLGDFNSYSQEYPLATLEAEGYAKISNGYSYSYDGLWGSLDHALVSSALAEQVTGSYKWAINAEEPALLDYNNEYKTAGQQSGYYSDDAYRSSDHNPLVLGLNLTGSDTIAPELQEGSVEEGKLVLTFNEQLSGNLPGLESFTVQVNGAQARVTSIQYEANVLSLELSVAIDGDSTITLDYTDLPEDQEYAVQDLAGNDAASFSLELEGDPAARDEKFIANLYRNALQREPDQEGLDFWTQALQSGEFSREDVLEQFSQSGEVQQSLKPVVTLYLTVLGRVPDQEGYEYWTQALKDGASVDEIAQYFFDSEEFEALSDEQIPDEEFIALTYQQVLGREPEQEGARYWLERLDEGAGRREIFASIQNAEEAQTLADQKLELILNFLGEQGRLPDGEEWAEVLEHQAGEQDSGGETPVPAEAQAVDAAWQVWTQQWLAGQGDGQVQDSDGLFDQETIDGALAADDALIQSTGVAEELAG